MTIAATTATRIGDSAGQQIGTLSTTTVTHSITARAALPSALTLWAALTLALAAQPLSLRLPASTRPASTWPTCGPTFCVARAAWLPATTATFRRGVADVIRDSATFCTACFTTAACTATDAFTCATTLAYANYTAQNAVCICVGLATSTPTTGCTVPRLFFFPDKTAINVAPRWRAYDDSFNHDEAPLDSGLAIRSVIGSGETSGNSAWLLSVVAPCS